jgi:hypothetical protein
MILPLSVTSTFFFILNVRKIRPTSVDSWGVTEKSKNYHN